MSAARWRITKAPITLGIRGGGPIQQSGMSEDALVPVRSKVLGYGAMVPIVASAAAIVFAPPLRTGEVPRAAIVWAGAVLAFLGGVRRGLSFWTPGGPRPRQLGGMATSFGLALAGLLSPRPRASCLLLAAGFADIAANDPAMAAHGEAPAFFAELRPRQMALAVAGLLVLAALLPGRMPR